MEEYVEKHQAALQIYEKKVTQFKNLKQLYYTPKLFKAGALESNLCIKCQDV